MSLVRIGISSLASLMLLLGGVARADANQCEGPPLKKVPGRSLNGRSLNGPELNGRSLNGRSLNGRSLNGIALDGLQINGRSLNGRSLNGVELGGVKLDGVEYQGAVDGSQIEGTSADGAPLTGCGLAGAQLQGVMVDEFGQPDGVVPLTITAALQDSDPDNSDVWFYDVSFPTKDGSDPLCGTYTDGGDVLAIALSGTWNYGQGEGGGAHSNDSSEFTLACDGAALFKCAIDLGYKPWTTDPAAGSLAPYHESCTRTLRADYCGDGTPHTIDGTVIDVYDNYGIQTDTDPSWDFEAEWDTDGALCVNHLRIGNREDIRCNGVELPHEGCGNPAHFRSGTLLMDRHNPTSSSQSTGGDNGNGNGSGGDNGSSNGCGNGNGGDNGGGGWGGGGDNGGGGSH